MPLKNDILIARMFQLKVKVPPLKVNVTFFSSFEWFILGGHEVVGEPCATTLKKFYGRQSKVNIIFLEQKLASQMFVKYFEGFSAFHVSMRN